MVFVLERPRFWPRVFSHHEFFHTCTVVGSSAHYVFLLQVLGR